GQRARRRVEQGLFVVLATCLVCDDRGALRERGAKPAGVIEVMVRIHDVANGLVWNKPVHLAEHRERALLIERRFNNSVKVAKIDGQAVMTPTGNEPDSIRQRL